MVEQPVKKGLLTGIIQFWIRLLRYGAKILLHFDTVFFPTVLSIAQGRNLNLRYFVLVDQTNPIRP
jgi:hypothetical protein